MVTKLQRGFSLLELMIVIAIIAIIAAIALPSYTQYLLKSRRADAKSGLMSLTNLQETFYTANGSYAANLTGANSLNCNTRGICSGTGGATNQAISADTFYTFEITDSGAAGYTITATPAPGSPQVDDAQCTSFTINNNLQKSATGSLGDDCWN